MLDRVDTHLEALQLMFTKHLDEGLSSVPVDLPGLCDIVGHLWQLSLVQIDGTIEGPLTDVQGREGGQEVITNEETEEDKVINDTLKVETHAHLRLEG